MTDVNIFLGEMSRRVRHQSELRNNFVGDRQKGTGKLLSAVK